MRRGGLFLGQFTLDSRRYLPAAGSTLKLNSPLCRLKNVRWRPGRNKFNGGAYQLVPQTAYVHNCAKLAV